MTAQLEEPSPILKRSFSTPTVRDMAQDSLTTAGEKKRNKLGSLPAAENPLYRVFGDTEPINRRWTRKERVLVKELADRRHTRNPPHQHLHLGIQPS
ncbi:hypothetical protein MY5147_002661 [Beauveria neobassiana]